VQTLSVESGEESSSSQRETAPQTILIGQDRQGNWVVENQATRYGGLFVSSFEALRYALRERDKGDIEIVVVAHPLELRVPPSEIDPTADCWSPRRSLCPGPTATPCQNETRVLAGLSRRASHG
jgi:hypothetical protein